MAVTFDAVSAGNSGVSTGLIISHTVGVGTDRLLLAGVLIRGLDNSPTGSTVVFQPTPGDQNLTLLNGTENYLFRVETWYLVNPSTGGGSLNLTLQTADASRKGLIGISLFGADQAVPETGDWDIPITGTVVNVSLSGLTDSGMIVDFGISRNQGAGFPTLQNAEQTLRTTTEAVNTEFWASTEPVDAATEDVGWTGDSSRPWGHYAVAAAPSGGGGGPDPIPLVAIERHYPRGVARGIGRGIMGIMNRQVRTMAYQWYLDDLPKRYKPKSKYAN